MKKNVGTLDAIIRISMGLTGLAWGISRMVRYPHRGTPLFITMISSLHVAEGINRSCFMYNLLDINTVEEENHHYYEDKLPAEKAAVYPME